MGNEDGQHRSSTTGPQPNNGQRQRQHDPNSSGPRLGRSIVPPSRPGADIDTESGAAGRERERGLRDAMRNRPGK